MALASDLMIIANAPGFQGRVKYWLESAAVAVMAEAANTASHGPRVNYAYSILRGSASVLEVTVAVLTNTTIAGEANVATTANSGYAIPDSDIQFAINSLFNALAGVSL